MFYHKNLNSFSLKCLYTVVPPQGEAKSEFEIFQLLSLRLGLGDLNILEFPVSCEEPDF